MERYRHAWLENLKRWYPKLHEQTYFLPPFHFNRVSFVEETLVGLPVSVLHQATNGKDAQSPSCSPPSKFIVLDQHVRDDRAQELVLFGLRNMASTHQEVMMVVSQLQYSKYLNKSSDVGLPIPKDLPQKFHTGDFDVLIIHRKYGLVVLEVKSVGSNFCKLGKTREEEKDIVREKVRKAVEQLTRGEIVLKHCMSDLEEEVDVISTLAVPNITSEYLLEALQNSDEGKKLCDILRVQELQKAVELSMCSDQVRNADKAWEWFKQLVATSSSRSPRPESSVRDLYENILARICGPATTVDVYCVNAPRLELRTEGEAIAETGHRMVTLQLYPEQFGLVHERKSRVCLTGPPGTGKTVVLFLKGLKWLEEGHKVHVLSTWYKSPACSYLIEHQLNKMKEERGGALVYRHHYDFVKEGEERGRKEDEVKKAVDELSKFAVDDSLYVIADEPGPDVREDALQLFVEYKKDFKQTLCREETIDLLQNHCSLSAEDAEQKFKDFKSSKDLLSLEEFQDLYVTLRKENMFKVFCKDLTMNVPKLHLWTGSIEHNNIPDGFEECALTRPLRSPPAIVTEVEDSPIMKKGKTVDSYSESPVPAPTYGPHIKRLSHRGHKSKLPQDCQECGEKIASVLEAVFKVGCEPDQSSQATRGLQYRDVLVICEDVFDEKVDEEKPASGLVQGLRKWECEGYKHFPVRVVEKVPGEDAIKDTSLALSNMVTVSHYLHVTGLERKVVVLAGDLTWKNVYWRLCDISRSTAQAILIDQESDNVFADDVSVPAQAVVEAAAGAVVNKAVADDAAGDDATLHQN